MRRWSGGGRARPADPERRAAFAHEACAIAALPSAGIGWPSNRTCPRSRDRDLAACRPSVDFPEPHSPTIPSVSPGDTRQGHSIDGAHGVRPAQQTRGGSRRPGRGFWPREGTVMQATFAARCACSRRCECLRHRMEAGKLRGHRLMLRVAAGCCGRDLRRDCSAGEKAQPPGMFLGCGHSAVDRDEPLTRRHRSVGWRRTDRAYRDDADCRTALSI